MNPISWDLWLVEINVFRIDNPIVFIISLKLLFQFLGHTDNHYFHTLSCIISGLVVTATLNDLRLWTLSHLKFIKVLCSCPEQRTRASLQLYRVNDSGYDGRKSVLEDEDTVCFHSLMQALNPSTRTNVNEFCYLIIQMRKQRPREMKWSTPNHTRRLLVAEPRWNPRIRDSSLLLFLLCLYHHLASF
jgi:hypothetical protein